MNSLELITRIYIGYFNRVPDVVGMTYWQGQYNAGLSLQQIINAFAGSDESRALYGNMLGSNVDAVQVEVFINSVYLNLFNRDAEPEGLAYWRSQILGDSGQSPLPIEVAILTIMEGALGDDRLILANKLSASVEILTLMEEQGISLPFEILAQALTGVTLEADSITSVIEQAFVPEEQGNEAPLAYNDVGYTEGNSRINVPVSDGVLANDSDPDGEFLRVTAVNNDTAAVANFIDGSNGGLFKLEADGSYRFYPMGDFDDLYPGQQASTSLIYTVSDVEGASDTARLTVTIVGVSPAESSIEPQINPAPGSGDETEPSVPSVESYDITLSFDAGAQLYAHYFESAATRLEAIIREGLPDTSYMGTSIDDLLIDASVMSIDGAGGTLGYAGPDAVRAGGLPYYGSMVFDSADMNDMVSNGILGDVIVHEMLHILGFGTLWGSRGLVSGSQYVGDAAVDVYRDWTGNDSLNGIPLTTGEGEGSDLSHWDEGEFSNELMTPYIDLSANPLSRLTVAALDDLGYAVNYSAADSYSLFG